MILGIQRLQTSAVEAVVGQLAGQQDFQAAQPCIGDGAGEGFHVVFARPIEAIAQPAGLAQFDRLALVEAGQGSAQGAHEILVADHPQLAAGRCGGEGLEGGVGLAVRALAADAVDLAQVERGIAADLLAYQAGQGGVGLGLVFLDRPGQRAAGQVDDPLQAGAVIPENARFGLGKGREGQADLAGVLKRLTRRFSGQPKVLGESG